MTSHIAAVPPYSPWPENERIAANAEQAFAQHGIARVRSAAALTRLAASICGKPIEIRLDDQEALKLTTAFWVDYGDRHRITLRRRDRAFYQTRSLHHDLAHIIMGHPTCIGHVADPTMQKYSSIPSGSGGLLSNARDAIERGEAAQWEGEAEYLAGLIARTLLHPNYLDDERLFG